MKKLFVFNLFCICVLFSCKGRDEQQIMEQQKDAQVREAIYVEIRNGWRFSVPPLNPKTQALVQDWKTLQDFQAELLQTPKSSIGAFQKKSKDLSKKVLMLNTTIPGPFSKPEIKSRISALSTKINAIDLYIHIDAIPANQIVSLVQDVNLEMISLYQQLDEIVRKSEIPKEEGESDMIRMLDTTRAIPGTNTKK